MMTQNESEAVESGVGMSEQKESSPSTDPEVTHESIDNSVSELALEPGINDLAVTSGI